MAQHRGFQDEYYHNVHLIEEWNKVVNKRDVTYILGDVTMEKTDPYYNLDALNGRKIVVLGNHDRWQHIPELLKYVDGVAGMIDYKGFALTHAPIHPSEMGFYRGNIHAHIHHVNKLEEVIALKHYADNDERAATLVKYHCVDAHVINYKPLTIDELLQKNL